MLIELSPREKSKEQGPIGFSLARVRGAITGVNDPLDPDQLENRMFRVRFPWRLRIQPPDSCILTVSRHPGDHTMPAPADCRLCPLSANSVFAELPRPLAEDLRRTRAVHEFRPGDVLFHEGTPADNVYCLSFGLAKEYRATPDGRQYVLGLAGPGDMPGTVAALQSDCHDSSLQAVRPTRACIIPRRILRAVLDGADAPARHLLLRLLRSLRHSQDARTSLALATVPERVAALLVDLARSGNGAGSPDSIELSVRRGDMAEMVGTTPETLSRILHTFRSGGLLELDRRSIRILDPEGLEEAAERSRP